MNSVTATYSSGEKTVTQVTITALQKLKKTIKSETLNQSHLYTTSKLKQKGENRSSD
jgi:ribosome-binding factor A